MKVIILAAGSGTRLGHYTKEIPKALVDINGKSIIERQIELFKKNGITEIFVVRGYKKEKFCFIFDSKCGRYLHIEFKKD